MLLENQSISVNQLTADVPMRMASSAEGRFTILNEQSKDSEGFDENTDSDYEERVFSKTYGASVLPTVITPLQRAKQISSHSSLPPMRLSGSYTGRLRAGNDLPPPPPRKYKRGRWECNDWYPSDVNVVKREIFGHTLVVNNDSPRPSIVSKNKNMHEDHPPLIHEHPVFSLDMEQDNSDESDRENLPEFSKSPPTNFEVHQPSLTVNTVPTNTVTGAAGNADKIYKNLLDTPSRSRLYAASPDFLSGRATPLEMQLHYGLERSLSGTGGPLLSPFPFEARIGSPLNTRGSSVPPPDRSSGNAGNSQIVAIDSKIEQAMDLVKTHLMFAVREEVEVLRNKILQLETTVLQLEAENAILREHVPTEILQNLNGGSGAPTSQNTTYVAAQ